jgi:hypothetical protein
MNWEDLAVVKDREMEFILFPKIPPHVAFRTQAESRKQKAEGRRREPGV